MENIHCGFNPPSKNERYLLVPQKQERETPFQAMMIVLVLAIFIAVFLCVHDSLKPETPPPPPPIVQPMVINVHVDTPRPQQNFLKVEFDPPVVQVDASHRHETLLRPPYGTKLRFMKENGSTYKTSRITRGKSNAINGTLFHLEKAIVKYDSDYIEETDRTGQIRHLLIWEMSDDNSARVCMDEVYDKNAGKTYMYVCT